jgi:hypothetical protein
MYRVDDEIAKTQGAISDAATQSADAKKQAQAILDNNNNYDYWDEVTATVNGQDFTTSYKRLKDTAKSQYDELIAKSKRLANTTLLKNDLTDLQGKEKH